MVLNTGPTDPAEGGSSANGDKPVTPTVEEEENLEEKDNSRDDGNGRKDGDESSDDEESSGSDNDSQSGRRKKKQPLHPPEIDLTGQETEDGLTPEDRERLAREEQERLDAEDQDRRDEEEQRRLAAEEDARVAAEIEKNNTPPVLGAAAGNRTSTGTKPKPPLKRKKGSKTNKSPPAKQKDRSVAKPGTVYRISSENGDPAFTRPTHTIYLGYKDPNGHIYRIKVSRIGSDQKSIKAYLLYDNNRYLFHSQDLRADPGVDVLTPEEADQQEREERRRHDKEARRRQRDEAEEADAVRAEADRVASENQAWVTHNFPRKSNRHYDRSRTDSSTTRRERGSPATPSHLKSRSDRPPRLSPSPPTKKSRRTSLPSTRRSRSAGSPLTSDDESPTTSTKLRLARVEARNAQLELQLTRTANNQTSDLHGEAIRHLLQSSNTLTEDQEDRKNNKPIIINKYKTTIPAMDDDNHHKLTNGRFLPIPSDFPYGQTKVPKSFEPIRSNYPFDSFGLHITKMAGVHKCHSRQNTELQLKSYTDANLRKVDTPKSWIPTKSSEIIQRPLDKDIQSVQEATLALFNFFTINHLICPFNSETLQLFSAVFRSQISGYPGINAADVAELFTQWLLKRNACIDSEEVIPYQWYEDKITQITHRRRTNLAEADLDHRDAAVRIAKYGGTPSTPRNTSRRNNNSSRTPNRNKPVSKPSTKAKTPARTYPQATAQNPSISKGQFIPCRDFNREIGCSRPVTPGNGYQTCAHKDMVYVHRCSHRGPGGRYCLENHMIKDHK